MKTEKEVRKSFWNSHPQLRKYYKVGFTQNQYSTDIRCAFCDYVDFLQKDGIISEELAKNVTL